MNKYINRPVVGIDVAAEFSMVAILAPDGEVYRKSFRINHTLDGFEYLASEIKKVEEKYDMKVASFMESTGVYHISLFHFLNDNKFDVFTINPLIGSAISFLLSNTDVSAPTPLPDFLYSDSNSEIYLSNRLSPSCLA